MRDMRNPISDGLCVIDCGGVFPHRGRLGLQRSLNSNWTPTQGFHLEMDISHLHPDDGLKASEANVKSAARQIGNNTKR